MLPPWLLRNEYARALANPVVVGLLAATAVVTLYSLTSRDKAVPEGAKPVAYLPGAVPILGHTLEMFRNLDRFHDWMAETSVARGGKAFVLKQPGKNDWYLTANPEDFEQILKVHFDTFVKGDHVREVLDDFMGENVVIINGHRWKFQRKALVNLFTARALREHMTPIVQKCVLALQRVYADAAKMQETIDVHSLMGRFTLETFAEIEFGSKLGLLEAGGENAFEEAIDDANHVSLERLAVPSWFWKLKRWLNVGSERRLRQDMALIKDFVMANITGAIERRKLRLEAIERGEPVEPVSKDIVSILLDSDETEDEPVTPSDVFNISLAGVLAGKDTTGDATSWLFHMLNQNPRVEQKLRAELLSRLPKLAESESYVPSMDDLEEITYLEATIRESLRLKPPAPCVSQHCNQDTVFPDGTFIAKGTDTMLMFHAAGLLESVWGPDAAEFKPERFLDEETGKLLTLPPMKFIAFSAGPRVCVGRKLAMVEMKLVTACLMSRFHLAELPGQDIRGTMGISLGMKNGLKVNVKPIAGVAARF
ncbi:hypothetical protein BBJ28_00012780 [Nothophytophthora sp. Chile5]|nr:hypothetical protein BBJ28_00012780 [Nothophytophthora sp. Chile5]